MKIAVLTLTRDRLAYTKRAFQQLRKYAGCEFDHYVLDNGSKDGTPKWLEREFEKDNISFLCLQPTNIGIPDGLNVLLDELTTDYDVVVKIDNDCELQEPDTLRDVAELTDLGSCFLSPQIGGLVNTPEPSGEFLIDGETILDIPQIGGIFLSVPGWVYGRVGFRYTPNDLPPGYDDVEICHWFRSHGGRCGYVKDLWAHHMDTTKGQEERYPDYFNRKREEYETWLKWKQAA